MSYIPNISVQINGLDSPTVGSFWDGNIDPPGLPILPSFTARPAAVFRGPPQLRKLGPRLSLAAESEPLIPMAEFVAVRGSETGGSKWEKPWENHKGVVFCVIGLSIGKISSEYRWRWEVPIFSGQPEQVQVRQPEHGPGLYLQEHPRNPSRRQNL